MGIIFYFLNKDSTYHSNMKAKELNKIKFLILAVPEKPKIEKKPELKTNTKKKIEQKPKLELVKEPIIEEPIPKPEPVEKVIIEESIHEPEVQKEATSEVIEPVIQEEVQEQIQAANIATALQHKQDIFIANLVERINSNKSYPNMARRRAIEGSIEVKFKILSDGDVREIEIVNGKSVFKKSAVQAIDRSFPMKIDSKLFNFPKEFKITIIYVLK